MPGREVDALEPPLKALNTCIAGNTSAKAAMDMALHDLYGPSRTSITTDITISVNSPEKIARDTHDAISRGYTTIKVKVGANPALKIASAAEVYSVECMIGCMLEAGVSVNVNAAVHLACARGVITKIDLDGPSLCSENPVHGGSNFNDREIEVSQAPGLGGTGIDGLRYL